MVRVACPRCHGVIEADPYGHPTCPNCGFTGAVGETPPPSSFRVGARGASPRAEEVPPVTYATQPDPWAYSPHAQQSHYPVAQRTNSKALVALVLGILGLTLVPFVPSVIAVILGHGAKQEIRNDPSQTGDGLATAGIVLGWIAIGLTLLVLLFVMMSLLVFSAAR